MNRRYNSPIKKENDKKLVKVISYPFNAIKNIGLKTRFSISYRIALSNLRLLIQYSILIVIVMTVGMAVIFLKNVPIQSYYEFTSNVDIEDTQSIEDFCRRENISLFVYSPQKNLIYKYSFYNFTKKYIPIPFVIKDGDYFYLILPDIVKNISQPLYINIFTDITYGINTGMSILKILSGTLIFVIVIIGYRSSKIAKQLLSPLRELSRTILQISESNMTSRLNVSDCKYELKEIAQSFNKMMDTIENSYDKQKQFVSDASHELRTPIAVLQGYANMLDRWGKNDPKIMQESIDAILEETDNMKDLVEKLLFIARSDKSTFKMDMTEFQLSPLITDLSKEFGLIAPKKHINCRIISDSIVFADKNRIKEAYRIIIDNAVKYSPEDGHISLTLYTENSFSCLSVKDNGSGIPKDELPKIFDRFYSKNRGSKDHDSKSHGLGLALAKIIVLAHNGKITVKSTPGIGAEFIIKIPVT